MSSAEDKNQDNNDLDFYFRRTSFRIMNQFFRNAYKPFAEKVLKSSSEKWKERDKEDKEIENSLTEFTNSTFKGLLKTLSKEAQFEFIELLKLLVFTHFYRKDYPCF